MVWHLILSCCLAYGSTFPAPDPYEYVEETLGVVAGPGATLYDSLFAPGEYPQRVIELDFEGDGVTETYIVCCYRYEDAATRPPSIKEGCGTRILSGRPPAIVFKSGRPMPQTVLIEERPASFREPPTDQRSNGTFLIKQRNGSRQGLAFPYHSPHASGWSALVKTTRGYQIIKNEPLRARALKRFGEREWQLYREAILRNGGTPGARSQHDPMTYTQAWVKDSTMMEVVYFFLCRACSPYFEVLLRYEPAEHGLRLVDATGKAPE